ncbi:cytochrome b-c1 complex subunit 8 [Coccinella septempunctata]|uniref:cytochrome b-c1 complex subunit 8 n=1 Tax=Coccinella septempunctata TaxID=41139 RepID=UPI001D08BD9E|nr:cytochrome b-c1 complex subunit 8 [Coccinella septempunctata]
MGHGFGELAKIRGIVTYRLSPFELKAFGGVISHGIPNTFRRIKEEFLYVVPPFVLGYLLYDGLNKEHARLQRKNPADFADEK